MSTRGHRKWTINAFVFISSLQFRCMNIARQYTLFDRALERNAPLKSLQVCSYPRVTGHGGADKNWTQLKGRTVILYYEVVTSKYDLQSYRLKWGIFRTVLFGILYFRASNSAMQIFKYTN
jgi:hypothetical protein